MGRIWVSKSTFGAAVFAGAAACAAAGWISGRGPGAPDQGTRERPRTVPRNSREVMRSWYTRERGACACAKNVGMFNGSPPDAGALARPDRLSSLFPHRGRSLRGEMDDR